MLGGTGGSEFYALDNVSIIIPIAPVEAAHETLLNDLKQTNAEIILSCEGSRAKSLNAGAVKAQRAFLWFLHADSQVNSHVITSLEQALKQRSNALHYFDLAYTEGGMARLNAAGANIRSRLFDLPYGDQGLCLSKTQFDKIGGYPEDAPYGEDALLVRKAKQSGVKLSRIPAKLYTSARKYKEMGWLKLTAYRQFQIFKLLRQKL